MLREGYALKICQLLYSKVPICQRNHLPQQANLHPSLLLKLLSTSTKLLINRIAYGWHPFGHLVSYKLCLVTNQRRIKGKNYLLSIRFPHSSWLFQYSIHSSVYLLNHFSILYKFIAIHWYSKIAFFVASVLVKSTN